MSKNFNGRSTSLCYLERDGKYLILHRTKKEHDENGDKWIGVGGKFEPGETPDECALREVKEETGLTMTDYRLRGLIIFISDVWGLEYMYLYTATKWRGKLTDCDEGELVWLDKRELLQKNLWEGDKLFLKALDERKDFFIMKLRYEGERLAEVVDSQGISDFRLRVYRELLKVPQGTTVTYGELARRLGCGSAQAVGQALRHNPFAPEIPCHRVVASDGSLGGYGGSRAPNAPARKQALLDAETALASKLIAALAVGFALCGCTLKEMKSTPFYEGGEVTYVGEASERVNLWPVAYWRNPVGSVIWPLFSFSDDHFAFRPIYSQYKQDGAKGVYDEYNVLWPITQADTKAKDYRVFPFLWGETCSGGNYQAVFPIYWNGPHYNSLYPLWICRSNDEEWSFLTCGGLAGAGETAKGYRSSWCFPLWYENNRGVLVTTLFGYSPQSRWCFPLWYRDNDRFISLAYSSGRDPCDKVDTWWASPGLLSWGSTDVWRSWTTRKGRILLGLGGWTDRVYDTHASQAWWAWPLVGRTQDAHSTDTWLLSGLVGWESGKDSLRESHVYPLYDWERDDHLLTLLGGSSREDIWLTPLVGIRREKNKHEGGWVFPFWWHEKNRDYDENLAKLDRPTLPDCIKVKMETRTNDEAKVERRLWAKGPKGRDETVWFLLSDNDRSFYTYCGNRWNAVTNDCEVAFRHKVGNRLLLNYESKREMRYDLKTKAKLSDKEEAEASFLVWLYQYEYERDRRTDEAYARHRVLWRLWDWEEDDGDIALDVFPGFTYDSRRDGYTKTSLLWRFFRNEYDPKEGRKVDVLFIPVWR